MAAAADDSNIFIPFMPSLLHLSLVKVGIHLLYDFDMETLNTVFTEILPGYSPGFYEGSQENLEEAYVRAKEISRNIPRTIKELIWTYMVFRAMNVRYSAGNQENRDANYKRAKENILFIPKFLRSRLLETVIGLYYSIQDWRRGHLRFLQLKDIKAIYFRSDGTVDRFITAQQLVLNENINLKVRFNLACVYCLEESVRTLWEELESAGETSDEPMATFWIEWLRDESRIPWIQAIPKYVKLNRRFGTYTRFSSFFPFMRPEERKKHYFKLDFTSLNDVHLCLSKIPRREGDRIIRKRAAEFLIMHLSWPFRSLFLETANRLMKYMDSWHFKVVLSRILELKETRKDFDYSKLFAELCDITPDHLKEIAEQSREAWDKM